MDHFASEWYQTGRYYSNELREALDAWDADEENEPDVKIWAIRQKFHTLP